jgi:HK97 gp10 family phage protein
MARGSKAGVSIEGFPALERAMAQFTEKTQEKIEKRAARKAAKPVREKAQLFAPYDEGDLEASIKIRALKRSRKSRRVGVRVMTSSQDNLFTGKQFYGAFLEFGTAYIAPRPYMGRARDETRMEVRRIFHAEMQRIIRETANEVRPRKTTGASKGALKFAGAI